MAKEFKVYDKKYAKLMGGALNFVRKLAVGEVAAMVDKDYINLMIERWPEQFLPEFTEKYSHGTIRFCVYDAPDSNEWQKFRVGLKGLNTREKLACLYWWWMYAHEELHTDRTRDIIRVNNYLGALKRSGLLDSNLKISKP